MMKKSYYLLFLATAFLLTSCVTTNNSLNVDEAEWTGLDAIKNNAKTADEAGYYYNDCVVFQIAATIWDEQNRGKKYSKEQKIRAAIKRCRPTGRYYAELLIRENTKVRRQISIEKNIDRIVLPSIEKTAYEELVKSPSW